MTFEAVRRVLRLSLLVLLSISLGGCFITSTYVSSIGARAVHGASDVTERENEVSVDLKDTTVDVAMKYGGLAIPYVSLAHSPDGDLAGTVTLKREDILWKAATGVERSGEITVALNETPTSFKARQLSDPAKQSDTLLLERRYRRWYGYPAQLLLVVSVPVDLAADVIMLGAVIVALPFWGIALAVQSNKPSQTDEGAARTTGVE